MLMLPFGAMILLLKMGLWGVLNVTNSLGGNVLLGRDAGRARAVLLPSQDLLCPEPQLLDSDPEWRVTSSTEWFSPFVQHQQEQPPPPRMMPCRAHANKVPGRLSETHRARPP